MSVPIRVYIVELLTATETKAILVTADRADAQAMVDGFNIVVHETTDDETPRLPQAILRTGLAFYQASPSPVGKVVLA